MFFQTLYESSTALGFKKSNNIEQGKEAVVVRVRNLEQGNIKLREEVRNNNNLDIYNLITTSL